MVGAFKHSYHVEPPSQHNHMVEGLCAFIRAFSQIPYADSKLSSHTYKDNPENRHKKFHGKNALLQTMEAVNLPYIPKKRTSFGNRRFF